MRNSLTATLFRSVPLVILLVCSTGSSLRGATRGQFHLSPYFDSNVRESLAQPDPSFGLKLSSRFSRSFPWMGGHFLGDILTQSYLDARYNYESKLILNPEVGFQRSLSPHLQLVGLGTYFSKSFFFQSRSYSWTEYSLQWRFLPFRRLSTWLGYRWRSSLFRFPERLRFRNQQWEGRAQVRLTPETVLEGALSRGQVSHQDFLARGIKDDTLLVSLDYTQQDITLAGQLHIRRQGKVIYGIQAALESVSSNSVIGSYRLLSVRFYLSGHLGRGTFYHLVVQREDKEYSYPRVQGITRYRDPEELTQNRSYFRLERVFEEELTGYLQITWLQNETLFNQQYYSKALLEAGIKYEF